MAVVDMESWGKYVQSTLSKRHPNCDYKVFRSFAFAVSKTQGGKPEASNTFLIKLETIYDRF